MIVQQAGANRTPDFYYETRNEYEERKAGRYLQECTGTKTVVALHSVYNTPSPTHNKLKAQPRS